MTTTYSTSSMTHVAGSSFGMLLESADVCPIADPTLTPIDTADWGIELVLVGQNQKLTIQGSWLSSFEPWQMSFQQSNTTAWPPGVYRVRLAYTTPSSETHRRFEQPLSMMLEVVR